MHLYVVCIYTDTIQKNCFTSVLCLSYVYNFTVCRLAVQMGVLCDFWTRGASVSFNWNRITSLEVAVQ